MSTQSKIVIVGSGFGFIGMAIALRKAGFRDFVSWKRPLTWAAPGGPTQYPGRGCDVPSPLYSFSYKLNPLCTRLFAPQPETWEYLRGCAAKYEDRRSR